MSNRRCPRKIEFLHNKRFRYQWMLSAAIQKDNQATVRWQNIFEAEVQTLSDMITCFYGLLTHGEKKNK